MTDDELISRIEAALEDHVLCLFTDSGNHAFSADDIRTLLDRLKAAEAENERLRDALEAVVAYRTGGLIERLCREALENTDAR